ncbi:MAG: hypothetical protein JXR83_13295 [Deltaproteobacteria bacterium]|nr:hypothetical protein [Deltaproteobacteria bacterium]
MTEPATTETRPPGTRGLSAHQLTAAQRVGIMLLSYLPLLHVATVLAIALWPWAAWPYRLLASAAALYLAPPLLARLVLALAPIRGQRHAVGSRAYATWWLLLMLQTVFCRFPALDEVLRLVPALYSMWLRLWGSRIGRLTYWAPGTLVLDRSFLDLGDDVIFGASVTLSPHLVARNAQGDLEFMIAPIRVGHRALVGGFSAFAAGSEIADDDAPRAFTLSPPFSRWRDGKRVREPRAPASPPATPIAEGPGTA